MQYGLGILAQTNAVDAHEVAHWLDHPAVTAATWLLILLVGVLVIKAVFTRGILQRSPLRDLGLTRVDLAIGMVFVALAPLVTGIPAAVFFIAKAWMCPAGLRVAGLVPRRPIRDLLYAAMGLLVGVVVTAGVLSATAAIAEAMQHPAPDVNHSMLVELQNNPTGETILKVVLLAVVMAPLLEELAFRGLLQTVLLDVFGRHRRWAVLLTAAGLFAVVHLGPVTWHALPGLFVLGTVLGWLYEKTGSLWPSILVHAGFNTLNRLFVVLGARGEG